MANSIIVKAGLNDSAFHAGMGRMQAGALKLKNALGGMGAALSVGALVAMGRSTLQTADDISTAAATIGVSTDYLQEFQYAAEQSGIGIEKASTGLQRFARRLAQAQQGSGELLPTLKQMSVAMFDQAGNARSSEEVMNDFADSLMSIKDPQAQLLAGFNAFGREGAAMIVMLKGGSAGLNDLRKQAHAAGAVLDADLISELDGVDKALKRIGRGARIKFAEFAGAAIKAFKFASKFAEKFFDQFFARLPIMIATFKKLLKLDFKGAAAEFEKRKAVTKSINQLLVETSNETEKQISKEKELNKLAESRKIAAQQQVKALEAQSKAQDKLNNAESNLKTAKQDRSKFTVKELAGLDNDNAAGDPILKKLNEQIANAQAGLTSDGKKEFKSSQFEAAKLLADKISGFESLAEALKQQGNFKRSQSALAQADRLREQNPFLKSNEQNPFKMQQEQLKAAKEQLKIANEAFKRAGPNGAGDKVNLHFES
jgi:hypothetical protein